MGTCLVVGVEALGGLGLELAAQLAVVVATLCYAIAAIAGRRFNDYDPMVPAAGSLLAGAALLVPASLAIDRPWTLAPATESVAALFGLSIVSTALAFTIYFRLLKRLGSISTTAQSYLRAPIGVAIGAVALSEALASTAVLGLACIVIGVAAMTVPPLAPKKGLAAPAQV
jgi:drug/metabolite transporter (DMT)-like permease